MTEKEIHELWEEFILWVRETKGCTTIGGCSLIVLWYEYLRTRETSEAIYASYYERGAREHEH